MKILYVDLKYDYGNPQRGINQIGEIGFHQVFKTLGHQVDCFYYDEYLNRTELLQELLLKKTDEVKPDLIFFCLFGEQFKIETLDILKSNTKTMNWFGDDQWRFSSFTSKYAPHFSYSISTDPFAISKYQELGCKNVFLSQWAALNIPLQENTTVDYKFDVSFVGGCNSTRRWIVAELLKHDIKVQTYGFGWPNGGISLDRMIEVFRTSRINLNLSNSISMDIRYLTFQWKNPIVALRTPKSASQIKARNFEIPYYGGFQLTDYVPTIERYFNLGEELICYSNVDEAALLIKYYLQNSVERERIKTASIQRARLNHTYLNRFSEIFARL